MPDPYSVSLGIGTCPISRSSPVARGSAQFPPTVLMRILNIALTTNLSLAVDFLPENERPILLNPHTVLLADNHDESLTSPTTSP